MIIDFWSIMSLIGLIIFFLLVIIIVLSFFSLMFLYFFHRKGKLIFPYFFLSVISTLEVPIERLIRFFQIEGFDTDYTIKK